MITRGIQQEDRTLINVHAPNIELPRHIKVIVNELKGKLKAIP